MRVAILIVLLCSIAHAQYVWWEGENPTRTNFPAKSWFSPETFPDRRGELSGNNWLSNSGKRGRDEAFAVYTITVPADGEYNFWTRKFWKHGPFRWRFDEQDWQTCGRDIALADDAPLRKFVTATWVSLGKVKLSKGQHTFELRLLAKEGEDQTACFDCFLLIPGPFKPSGKLKPGEKSGKAEDGFFAFEPPADPFGQAALDLRSLNEKEAGQSGFLKRSGSGFALGDGTPVRFWAVNIGPEVARQDHASIDYMARRLAKLGVNMARFHGDMFDINKPDTVNQPTLDGVHYLVSAMKKQGIYTKISFYFPLWHQAKSGGAIGGFDDTQNKHPFALLFFEPKMQEIYKGWARKLLTTPNPHTGKTLAQDPAVAIVEVMNEDSFFFWTFNKKAVPPEHWAKLEAQFGQWLARRYGSIDKAQAAWGGVRVVGDDPAAGRAGVLEVWHLTAAGLKSAAPSRRKRVSDQVRFLAELQRDFYTGIARYFRDDLKVGGLVSASNWHVADPAMLDALERWTYTATDVIDQHGYFGGKHEGDGAGFSVRVDHKFTDLAGVMAPERLPIRSVQVDGFPQIISELGHVNPNRFRADCTLLSAAYGSLQGIDGIYFFAIGSTHLLDQSMQKFGLCSPAIASTFPAAALLYRRGDVKTPEPVVREVIDPDDLVALKGSSTFSEAALDELRKRDVPPGAPVTGPVGKIDSLACFTGPVVRAFGNSPAESRQTDLRPFIDRQAKTIKSVTSELMLDYATGLLRMSTPRAQGAAGFLAKAGKIELGDLTIQSANEFGSIVAIALDDQPLATSKKILLQAMTEERPHGFRVEDGVIKSLGSWPWNVRKIAAQVTLKNAPAKVTALDENGYATDRAVKIDSSPATIHLADDCIYYLITR